MALAETARLVTELDVQDRLTPGLQESELQLAKTSTKLDTFESKVKSSGVQIREFRRLGSELGVVGRALGGDFETATNTVGDFTLTAGSAALALRGIAQLAPTVGATIASFGTGLALVAGPLAVLGVGVAAFAIAAQRTVTPVERAQTAVQVLSTRVALLDRQLAAGQISTQRYNTELAQLTGHTAAAGKAAQTATSGFGPFNVILEAVQKSLQLMNAEIDKSGIGIVTVTGLQKTAADAAEQHRLRLLGEAEGFNGVEQAAKNAAAGVGGVSQALDELPIFKTVTIKLAIEGAGAGALAATVFSSDAQTSGLTVDSKGRVLDTGSGAHGDTTAADNARTQREQAAEERRRKAEQAANERAQRAKQAAEELAQANREKVANSYDAAKRASDRLFDSLHDRHIKAIKDAENLAEKNHDAALQTIEDNLAASRQANAAPVTAAEQAQSATERARQLRDLQESVQAAQQALATNRDQSQVAGLQRSLRDALEALQSFNAQDAIDKLKVAQTANDTAAEQAAKNARDKADADLEAAKLQAAASEALVNKQDTKKKQDFDVALAALKQKDQGSPAQFLTDLKALETKFGIFTDQRGFTHIGDVVADAIKNTPPPPVHITLQVPRGAIQLNGRDVNNASTVGISPTQSQSTRSGNAKPKGN